jgi:hypothetical protein
MQKCPAGMNNNIQNSLNNQADSQGSGEGGGSPPPQFRITKEAEIVWCKHKLMVPPTDGAQPAETAKRPHYDWLMM